MLIIGWNQGEKELIPELNATPVVWVNENIAHTYIGKKIMY